MQSETGLRDAENAPMAILSWQLIGGALLCIVFMAFGENANATDVSVAPSSSAILYTGRWDQSTPSAPWAQAQGSSIALRFQASEIAATLNTATDEYFRIIINDESGSSEKVLIPSGQPTTLASGLGPGVHKVEIIKETDVARTTFLGFTLDAGALISNPPERPERRIVFYGDSNLAGYSLESERNECCWNLTGSQYTYAGITARMFDAEYHNISKSGARISRLNARFDRIDWESETPHWNFNDDMADVVVVNIGANDYWISESTNKEKYHALLDDLRDAHPSAHIMLFNAYGWTATEPAGYIHEVIEQRDDSNMSAAVFPWVFEQYHGSETEHAGMASVLAEHLSEITGWVANDQDVMSGFGRDGDVANGSFEHSAPFGGYGWRYFDDPGVSREFDPDGAFDGSYYLRLSAGASSHQTNPADDGALRTLSVWMRGEHEGDEVDITIDFRDQESGGEINPAISMQTETKTLTTDWQHYTMTATAPTSPANPVYASRLTFQARENATVDIDRVAVPEPSALPMGPTAQIVLTVLLAASGLRSRREEEISSLTSRT